MSEGVSNFNISKIAKEIKYDELTTKNDRAKEIFSIFNTNTDGGDKLTTDELAKAFAEIDTNNDGNISEEEITQAADNAKINGQNLNAEQKTAYITFLKEMAAKNTEKIADSSNVGNTYTVQMDEDYDDIIKRVLKEQGVENPTEEQITKAKAQFEADNPGALKWNKSHTKQYLLVGAKVNLRYATDPENSVHNKNNSQEQIDAWTAKYRGGVQDAPVYTKPTVDEEKINNSTHKEAIKTRLDEASDILVSFAKNSSGINSDGKGTVEFEGTTYDTKEFSYDGKKVKVLYYKTGENAGKIAQVWLNTGGGKYDVSIKTDGSGAIYTDKTSSDTRATFGSGAINFSQVLELVKKFAGETFGDDEVQEAPENSEYTQYADAGANIGEKIYENVSGTNIVTTNQETYDLIASVNSKNVYYVINAFNAKSKGDEKEGIVQFLDNESDFKAQQIAKIIKAVLDLAVEAGVDRTSDAYKDLLSSYNLFNTEPDEIDDQVKSKQADIRIIEVMRLVNQKLQLGADPVSAS